MVVPFLAPIVPAVAAWFAGKAADEGGIFKPEVNPYQEPEAWKPDYQGASIGTPGGANWWSNKALEQGDQFGGRGTGFYNQAMDPTGAAQAKEDFFGGYQEQWGAGRTGQEEALGMMRSAALGQAPSVAQNQLQAGFNQAAAQQAALAGGARGSAALANAQANAAANVANLQQGTNQQAAMLRAQEMAEARGAFGGMAGQLRGYDQARLNMGNQMAMANAAQRNQYALGMGGLSVGMGNLQQGAMGQAIGVQGKQADINTEQQRMEAAAYQARQDRMAGVGEANAQARREKYRENLQTGIDLIKSGASTGAAAAGG
jgi:hypothetical protein